MSSKLYCGGLTSNFQHIISVNKGEGSFALMRGKVQTRSRPDRGRARRLATAFSLLALSPLQGFGCVPKCASPAAFPLARRCLPLAPSHSVDAARGWRSHAAVPQHSGPFPPQGPTRLPNDGCPGITIVAVVAV